MNLHLITQADLAKLYAIEQAAHLLPWPWSSFEQCHLKCYWGQWVAEAETALGFCWALPGVDEVQLLNIAVDPAAHRKGVAAMLLEALCNRALDAGLEQVFLEVRQSNAAAIALYDKQGFVEVGLRRDYYPLPFGGRENATLMAKQLRLF